MEQFNTTDYLKNDKELQREYLSELLNNYLFDGDTEAFLSALKPLIEAESSVSSFAKKSNINRTYFYKIFSHKTNPDFNTLIKIIQTFGFDMKIELLSA